MNKIPISLIVDDPAPIISVYHEHAGKPFTKDGRQLVPTYSNELLKSFCDIVSQHGIKGKFSIVPMPGNKGDIINGIEGTSPDEVNEWLDTVKERLLPYFTVGPEMLTHHKAVNLENGEPLEMNERDWASDKDRAVLTPYIAKALSLLKEAGFSPLGVTSPWDFGIEVEEEYEAAISQAVYDVTGSERGWFFLRSHTNKPNAKPWTALHKNGRTLISIPATTDDHIWQTINTPETSEEYISKVADELITADGKDGEFVRVLNSGGWPIILTHWQSLMSNGLGTGLKVLSLVAQRINENFGEKVEWMRFEEIMNTVADDWENYPRPHFDW